MTAPSPIGTVLGRGARALLRRWPFYLGVAVTMFALMMGFDALHLLKGPLNDIAAELIIFPLGVAVVNGFIASDIQIESGAVPIPDLSIWERIGERVWAVFVIDTIIGFIAIGMVFPTDELARFFYQIGAIILSALLAFADVHAVVEPELRASRVLQQSILASVRIAMTPAGYMRAILLMLAEQLLAQAIAQLSSVANDAVLSLLTVLASAVATAIYLDLRPVGKPSE